MSEEELSTKEKIINATFSLLKTQFFSTISLSKIAKEVNISKTAIYRHFENKEALEIALKNKIFEDMLVLLRNVDDLYDSKDYDGCIFSVLRFIRQYPEYLNYGFFSVSELGEDKELYQFYCMSLAERGFAVVNFTYRLAPEYKYPATPSIRDAAISGHEINLRFFLVDSVISII